MESSNGFLDAVAAAVGTLIGLAVAVWTTWCIVIGFVGGTYPLTQITSEGSVSEGISAMFVASIAGVLAAQVLIWGFGLLVALIAGASWVKSKTLGTETGHKRPFPKWTETELLDCVELVLADTWGPVEFSSVRGRVSVVFHQDQDRLPRDYVKNTIEQWGEFSPYIAFEIEVPSHNIRGFEPTSATVGWTSHQHAHEAYAAAREVIGEHGREASLREQKLTPFRETFLNVIWRPQR